MASGRQEPAPGRGLQGAGCRSGKRGQDGARARGGALGSRPQAQGPLPARPARPARSASPALRSAADMCAAPMPPLAHVFRGTFIHSTWANPMEVLRDHLLGVSDSGKVSGRGVRAPDARGQADAPSRGAEPPGAE